MIKKIIRKNYDFAISPYLMALPWQHGMHNWNFKPVFKYYHGVMPLYCEQNCQGMSTTMFNIYNRSLSKSLAWECLRCGMPNYSTSLFDTTAAVDTDNRFESLSSFSDPDSPIPDNIAASSLIVQQSKEAKTKKARLDHPFRILIMNCQSIENKKAEHHAVIDSAKPDIILENESWLSPNIKNSEIFQEPFDAIRKDRVGDALGGVFIAFKRDLLCTETQELDTHCEIVWC